MWIHTHTHTWLRNEAITEAWQVIEQQRPAGVDISYRVDPSVHKDGLIGADETGKGNHAHGPIIIPL